MSHAGRVAVVVVALLVVRDAAAADKRADAAGLYRDGKYEAALKLFRELSVETGNPGYLCNIGRCHEKLGHLDDAVQNIEQCLAQAKPDAKKRAEYDALLADLETRRRTAQAAAVPPPVEVPQSTGGPAIAIAPSVPVAPPSLAPPTGPPGAATVGVATEAPRSSGGVGALPIVGGVVGVVGLGAGVFFGLQARKAYRETAAQYNPAREKDGDRANLFQIIGYGVAGVGAAVAIIGAVMASKSSPSTASARSSLVAGPDGVGWTF